MVFHYASHKKTFGFQSTCFIHNVFNFKQGWRETSIRSLASILFIESESLLLTLFTVEKSSSYYTKIN